MRRKKKRNPPSRMKQFTMRVTEEMYGNLKQNTDAAHLSVMAYTRQLLSNRQPVVHNEIVYNNPELLKALGDIGKVGSNLNQIARYLNEGVDPTGQMMKEVIRCIIELQKMRNEIKEKAGEYRGNCKHISIKNSNYNAVVDHLTMQHDEFTNKPVLNEDGDQIPRDFYLLDGINCNPYTFNEEC